MKLPKEKYKEYIKSEDWQDVRRRYFASKLWKVQGKKCYCCEERKPVDLHHKTYKRLGYERLGDLIAICRDCHNETHELVKIGCGLYVAAKKIRQIKTCKKSAVRVYQTIANQNRGKLRKKKKKKKRDGWFHGLNKRDRALLKMELSLRDRGIKY